jgi:molecular chaperone DnaJ
MPSKRDYYEVLGIPSKASEEDIKRAFRRLAMEYHPDRNSEAGAEAKFKEVNEAYQVLTDEEKRSVYDRFGHAGLGANGGGQGFEGVDNFGGLGDIFEAFFGGSGNRTRSGPQRGSDLAIELTLSFEEAALGIQREVEIARSEVCPQCKGSRAESGTSSVECTTCHGGGQVRRSQQSLFGQFTQVTTCPTCRGDGRVIPKPCSACQGIGQERVNRKISIRVPAGIEDGSRMRLNGEGEAGIQGGSRGDLYTTFHVKEHIYFKRHGFNLLYDLPINFAQAALGDTVKVPTLYEPEELKVPAGVQNDMLLRLKGKGIQHLNANRKGDLLVRVCVVTPKKLTPEQMQLFTELSEDLEKPDGNEQQSSWFDRVKDTFGSS